MIIGTNAVSVTGRPIIINDTAAFIEAAQSANVGNIYLYTGAMTDTYTQNALYMIVNDEEVIY